MHTKFRCQSLNVRDYMGDQGIDSIEVDDAKVAYCVCLYPVVGCCEYGNEALGSVKGCRHLNQVNN